MVKIPIERDGDDSQESQRGLSEKPGEKITTPSLNGDKLQECRPPIPEDFGEIPDTFTCEEKVKVLEEKLSEKSLEVEELKDRLLRLHADFDNTKRRMVRERDEIRSFATEELMKEFLPVIDNLERALEAGGKGSDHELLLRGVKMTWQQFQVVLEKTGLQEIKTIGEGFDPAVHEALMMIPSDQYKENVVVQEFEKGYLIKDRLLRPAKVGVAQKGYPPPSSD